MSWPEAIMYICFFGFMAFINYQFFKHYKD